MKQKLFIAVAGLAALVGLFYLIPPTNLQQDQVEIIPDSEMKLPTKATIETTKGTIAVELYLDSAPKTVRNFADKVNSGFYDNLTFHRVEDWVIQGGDPEGNGTGGGEIATELSDRPFQEGSLGVARGPNINISNDAQFFITKTEALWLNNQYTNFGRVTAGMDVVESIEVGDKIISITFG